MAARGGLEAPDALGRLGGEEAVGVARGQHGAAARRHGTGLVDVDVGVLGADGALPVAQEPRHADDVGRGPADAELHVHVVAAARGADELAGALAVGVALGVAHGLLVVGGGERGQDLGRGALGVVVAEHAHGMPRFFSLLLSARLYAV